MPAYNVGMHREVRLDTLPPEVKERIVETIHEIAEFESPTSHPKVEQMTESDLLKIRIGDYRAVCRFIKPRIDLVLVGPRQSVYNNLETAEERAGV